MSERGIYAALHALLFCGRPSVSPLTLSTSLLFPFYTPPSLFVPLVHSFPSSFLVCSLGSSVVFFSF